MTIVGTAEILAPAAAAGRGVGAFNVLHLETAEALVEAAESAGLPVILQISENCVAYHGALAPIARACSALAEASTAAVSLHLDHAEEERLAREAIDLGFGSVMFDGAKLSYAENVTATRRVVQQAHAAGVFVEAELGEIGGKDGAHAPGVRTDPAEARDFVGRTGVDALAVAVGSSHAMSDRSATLDFGLIAHLAAAVPVPLVLHGSSGVADDGIVRAVRAGITKVNVSTHLNAHFTAAVRDTLAARPSLIDSRTFIAAGRRAVAAEAARLMELIARG